MASYNNELFRIRSQLVLCGQPINDEEQIEKTLSTFHSTNMILASQYRNMKFTKHSELIAHMLLAEKHQELLLKNSNMRPPRTLPPVPSTETNFRDPSTSGWTPGRGFNRNRRGQSYQGGRSFSGGRYQSFRGSRRGREGGGGRTSFTQTKEEEEETTGQ